MAKPSQDELDWAEFQFDRIRKDDYKDPEGYWRIAYDIQRRSRMYEPAIKQSEERLKELYRWWCAWIKSRRKKGYYKKRKLPNYRNWRKKYLRNRWWRHLRGSIPAHE